MSLRDWPIKQKLTAMLVVISGLVLLLTSAGFAGYQYWSLRQATRDALSVRGRIIAANSTASLAFSNDADARELLSALRADQHIVAAVLYDKDGHVFAAYPGDVAGHAVPAAPGPDGYRFEGGLLIGFQPVQEAGSQRLGTLYLASDLEAVYDTFRLSGVIGLAVLAVALLAACRGTDPRAPGAQRVAAAQRGGAPRRQHRAGRVRLLGIARPAGAAAQHRRIQPDTAGRLCRAAGRGGTGVPAPGTRRQPADGDPDRRPAETRAGHPCGDTDRGRGLERHGPGHRGRAATGDPGAAGGIRDRPGAEGAGRRTAAARGPRQSPPQQLEVHRETAGAAGRIRLRRSERRAGLHGPGQRRRLRHEVRGQAVRRVPAPAFRCRIRGHRCRPRNRPADHQPARRADLGGRRRRSGSDVLLHPVMARFPRAWRLL